MVRVPPSRSNSRSCKTRSSFTCVAGGTSPISSRNSVPLSASSNFPGLRCHGAGERAFLVAEKFALQQVLGNRRAS